MNSTVEPMLWVSGVFAATTAIALIGLRAIGLWWQGRAARKSLAAAFSTPRENQRESGWTIYILLGAAGTALLFAALRDTPYAPLSWFGIFAAASYAYLARKRADCKTWVTRCSVARGLDEMQVLASSRNAASVLDAHPWLERHLKRDTFFQQFDARLTEWIGHGLAQRGSQAALETLAREMQSEDLFQFLRRAHVETRDGDTPRAFRDAANAVGERIQLDAESFALRAAMQAIWLWLGMIAVLCAAALIPFGGK